METHDSELKRRSALRHHRQATDVTISQGLGHGHVRLHWGPIISSVFPGKVLDLLMIALPQAIHVAPELKEDDKGSIGCGVTFHQAK